MTVHPGFGGQKYIDECTQKIKAIRERIDGLGSSARLEVDGGINKDTIGTALGAGADTFVIGSSVFIGGTEENTKYFVKALRDYKITA